MIFYLLLLEKSMLLYFLSFIILLFVFWIQVVNINIKKKFIRTSTQLMAKTDPSPSCSDLQLGKCTANTS